MLNKPESAKAGATAVEIAELTILDYPKEISEQT